MLRALHSYFYCLKASASLGRASRLRERGRNAEALSMARCGLEKLRGRHVVRSSPPEAAALLTLTMLVEQLAFEEKAPGASPDDLRDSLAFLKTLAKHTTPEIADQLAWLPYLESRVAEQH